MLELLLAPAGNLQHGMQFLGERSDVITYQSLSDTLGISQGSLNTTTEANKWLAFILDGQELLVSKVAVRSTLSWLTLYNAGVVFGNNTIGQNLPPIAASNPVLQYRTVELAGGTYVCRLLKGVNEGQSISVAGYDQVQTQMSEYSRLFYPIVVDDSNVQSFQGPYQADYTSAQLQLRYVNSTTTPGSYNWCQERYGTSNSSVVRGGLGPSRLQSGGTSNTNVNTGWRAVLARIA